MSDYLDTNSTFTHSICQSLQESTIIDEDYRKSKCRRSYNDIGFSGQHFDSICSECHVPRWCHPSDMPYSGCKLTQDSITNANEHLLITSSRLCISCLGRRVVCFVGDHPIKESLSLDRKSIHSEVDLVKSTLKFCNIKVFHIDNTKFTLLNTGGFRRTMQSKATELGLVGFVRRTEYTHAEIYAYGRVDQIDHFVEFLNDLEAEGFFEPYDIDYNIVFNITKYPHFSIRRSLHSNIDDGILSEDVIPHHLGSVSSDQDVYFPT